MVGNQMLLVVDNCVVCNCRLAMVAHQIGDYNFVSYYVPSNSIDLASTSISSYSNILSQYGLLSCYLQICFHLYWTQTLRSDLFGGRCCSWIMESLFASFMWLHSNMNYQS